MTKGGGVTEHALILPTSVGPAGAIVTEPDGEQRGAIVVLQGLGAPARAGVNAIWTRVARDLAALGLVVLRFDFACEGDSTLTGTEVDRSGIGWRRSTDLAMLRDIAPWFLERAGERELLLFGSCHGGRVALEFAASDPVARALFLVTPFLWHEPRLENAREDRKPPDHEPTWANGPTLDSEPEIVAGFQTALSQGPVWLLTGDGDGEVEDVMPFGRVLEATGPSFELEVVPGIAIHPVGHPAQQEAVRGRLRDRVARHLAEREQLAPSTP